MSGFLLAAALTNAASAETYRAKAGGIPGYDCDCAVIQVCLDEAAPGDTVLVAAGVYSVRHADPTGTQCIVELSDSVKVISEEGAAFTIIDPLGAGRAVWGSGLDGEAELNGFTLRGGDAGASGPADTRGGGIHLSGASPRIKNCVLEDNVATEGGGVFLDHSSPRFSDCVFDNNESSGYGGGVDCVGESSPAFVECRFQGNMSQSGGGGLSCRSGSTPIVEDSDFLGNTADWYGGGVFSHSSRPRLTRCLLSGNHAFWYGGGIQCYRNSPAILQRCTITGNSAFFGGGISLEEECSATIGHCIVTFADDGEGIYTYDELSEPVLLCNDVFGNAGGEYGGYLTDQTGLAGNISDDPLFCNPEGGDYTLSSSSPCLNPFGCGLMGARDEGCAGAAEVAGDGRSAAATWGRVKSLCR